jgi:hypothetical protein
MKEANQETSIDNATNHWRACLTIEHYGWERVVKFEAKRVWGEDSQEEPN